MYVEIAEETAEGQMLLRGDRLISKEDDEVLGKRALNFGLLGTGQRRAEIYAADLSADGGRHFVDRDVVVG